MTTSPIANDSPETADEQSAIELAMPSTPPKNEKSSQLIKSTPVPAKLPSQDQNSVDKRDRNTQLSRMVDEIHASTAIFGRVPGEDGRSV